MIMSQPDDRPTAMARQGLGTAQLADFVGRSLVAKDALNEVLQNLTQAPLNIYLIHDENRRLSHRMRVFAQEMTLACAASDWSQN